MKLFDFSLSESGTCARTEILAGLTTFFTMSYIIVVQPAVLSGRLTGQPTGMDFGAVMTATCLAAAAATLIMGLYARYPIALAPGMGENFFFLFTVMPAVAAAGISAAWQTALGIVFVSGVLFLVLSFLGVRERIIRSISPSLKNGIAAGIGLFIAFIGLQHAGLIQSAPGSMVKLNPKWGSPDVIVFFFGLILTVVLTARRVRGAILVGILGATALAFVLRALLPALGLDDAGLVKASGLMTHFRIQRGVVALPPSVAPTFLKMNIAAALTPALVPLILVFLIMDVFDTVGTLVGVSEQAGLMRDDTLPRARQALTADAVGTVLGAVLGTSTVTSYIESAAGVEQGGRTGLTAVVTALLFLLALFFRPVVEMIGSYTPLTAPALVVVGSMMLRRAVDIDWTDITEAFPAFLILVGIPLGYSISDGLALGFITYPVVKLLAGRRREVSVTTGVVAAVMLVYVLFLHP